MIQIFNTIVEIIRSIKWTKLKVSILINIVLLGTVFFLFKNPKIKISDPIIVERIITIPGIEGKFDTIKLPQPIKYINNPDIDKIVEDYNKLKDSIAKVEFFKDIITINEYNEVYEDSLVKIGVYTKVQGKLLKQAPNYFIKPYTHKYKDTIIVAPYIPRNKLYGQVEVGLPITQQIITPVIKAGILLQNKRDNIWSLSYDTNKTFWVGSTIKF